MTKTVGVNEKGFRVGQWNQASKYSDRVVEQIRSLRDEGMTRIAIANKMEISFWTVKAICEHKRRASAPVRFKKVEV
jgi:orotate phosphoribosyltransferase-like protein